MVARYRLTGKGLTLIAEHNKQAKTTGEGPFQILGSPDMGRTLEEVLDGKSGAERATIKAAVESMVELGLIERVE